MKKAFLPLLAVVFTSILSVSCSDSDSYNPFDDQKKGDFYPKNIVIKKIADKKNVLEKWENITRDYEKRITGYKYTSNKKWDNTAPLGLYVNETREYSIDYYTNHEGFDQIGTNIEVNYEKSQNGMTERYNENIREIAVLNEKGYITEISSIIKHTDSGTAVPVNSTSNRTFSYSGDLCTSSKYEDNEKSITYKYQWNGYRLARATEHIINKKDGSEEYNAYEYTYDKKEVYPYTGNAIIPFVLSGIPQIYASMGYLGKCTPYVLVEENQSGYTINDKDKVESIEVNNNFILSGDANSKLIYKALSDRHSEYSFTFSK